MRVGKSINGRWNAGIPRGLGAPGEGGGRWHGVGVRQTLDIMLSSLTFPYNGLE